LDPAARAERAFDELALTVPWTAGSEFRRPDFFRTRFDFLPNALQRFVLDILSDSFNPGIMVIEAPMGKGKTELALLVAEIFAHRAQRGGLFFALPTQATSDGVFGRIKSWTEELNSGERHSINLVHGKAQFNEDFQALPRFGNSANIGDDEDDLNVGVTGVHTWFSGRKLSMLADFTVGTIDQLLLMALKAKHLMLRHLGLADKVVIIDECHAYDAYMSRFLTTSLRWLGAYGVPVIVLSATLPAEKRVSVIKAYLGLSEEKGSLHNESALLENRSYPLITYTESKFSGHALFHGVCVAFYDEDTGAKLFSEGLNSDAAHGIIKSGKRFVSACCLWRWGYSQIR
jgi:CRISPR-associated endonuclease/helicase Cas3